uniref:Uncharacterized protein n=1 Tax=Glossina palpalis gambiensis TaxID=67801 RepID=A0A1B0BPU2_9MUSC
MGQYLCSHPSENQIDQKTDVRCDRSAIAKGGELQSLCLKKMSNITNVILVWCVAAEILNVILPVKILLQMICHVNGRTFFLVSFKRRIHLYNFSNGYHLDTILLISVFMGAFGLDIWAIMA